MSAFALIYYSHLHNRSPIMLWRRISRSVCSVIKSSLLTKMGFAPSQNSTPVFGALITQPLIMQLAMNDSSILLPHFIESLIFDVHRTL